MHRFQRPLITVFSTLGIFGLVFLVLNVAYSDRILPGVFVGTVPVGGLTRFEAAESINARVDVLVRRGLPILIEGRTESLRLENLEFDVPADQAAHEAWSVGRRGSWLKRLTERMLAPFGEITVQAPVNMNEQGLESDLDTLADVIDQPRKDVRFKIEKGTWAVSILTDVRPGLIIDRRELQQGAFSALTNLDPGSVSVELQEDIPRARLDSAPRAKREVELIIAEPLILKYEDYTLVVSREQISSWVIPGYDGDQLVPALDQEALSLFVSGISAKINIPAGDPKITLNNGRVTEFIPPKPGKGLEEKKTIKLISDVLASRRRSIAAGTDIALPVVIIRPAATLPAGFEAITELVGKATTPLTGSPPNRIHNIKNGVRFLTGQLIQPDEEFSTLHSLGRIDNTTGYLPELVIKGDKTEPGFGGGLCQVSTTLFRAALDTGLPITARRSHSYRVSYYERDETGRNIGPGLDATIYQPDLDLRFKNDTGNPILIYGYVKGNLITFEFYGTRDGRIAKVDGPRLLSEISPGPAIYMESDKVAKGTVKQVEMAHPGGSAVANYTVTYPDGRIHTQEFKSSYRRWPARYLVGAQ